MSDIEIVKRLTKTEGNLLLDSRKNSSGFIGFQTGFRTHTKAGSYGGRSFDAAIKLRDKGLIELVSSERYRQQARHAYGTDHWTEHTYRLTPLGEKVLGQLVRLGG